MRDCRVFLWLLVFFLSFLFLCLPKFGRFPIYFSRQLHHVCRTGLQLSVICQSGMKSAETQRWAARAGAGQVTFIGPELYFGVRVITLISALSLCAVLVLLFPY